MIKIVAGASGFFVGMSCTVERSDELVHWLGDLSLPHNTWMEPVMPLTAALSTISIVSDGRPVSHDMAKHEQGFIA